jgi:hypothetical protein
VPEELYADAITGIAVTGSVVRIVMQQLEQKGLVRRPDQPGAAKEAAAETPAAKPTSPNFKK